ncbi:MAG: UbiD family decarboxylase [Desulfovibrio sp.]|nr:UbiD family decarboxylase [Desulfovibrio sp.]
MGYASLAECVADLERHGQLRRIDAPLDPHLELACVQRLAFRAGSPALLFTRPKGCRFPMLANLFGTRERVNFIFRAGLGNVKKLFELAADPGLALKRPAMLAKIAPAALASLPRRTGDCPALASECRLADLPRMVSWPLDGGPFITLPLVYTEDPEKPGAANLGMYRIQLAGNQYADNEVGLHYQLQRGIGIHHAKALARGQRLPVAIHVGGPPALTIAAVMPLPEGMNELAFAGMLGARRPRLCKRGRILADADFVIQGDLGHELKPEGPFGDHLGYYSARHDFPVVKVSSVHHRPDAIWPFTSVGRPPQEDTVFGDLIHELTAPLVSKMFQGIREIRAVDAAGVHPLLLAIGSERYTPWDACQKPRELLTQAMHLLGATQTALAKYVLLADGAAAPGLTCSDVAGFMRHVLERTDFGRDLHFFTASACDTLDYSGYNLHEGSRLIWATSGAKLRDLGGELADFPQLAPGFGNPRLVMPGVVAIAGPAHNLERDCQDEAIQKEICPLLAAWREREKFPLVIIVDDPDFCAASLNNFLWTTFTRSDPARDCYGASASLKLKHWGCAAPLVIDSRLKKFQPEPLADEPAMSDYIAMLAANGGPLAGLI